MKVNLCQCSGIVLITLIVLCLSSCATTDGLFEASVDVGNQRYKGDSYRTDETSDRGVGLNLGFLLYARGFAKNKTSFLQPGHNYNKYQLAYATPSQTHQIFGREKYRYLPSFSHKTSAADFLDHVGVLTGLEFIQKNSKYEGTKIKLNYLQLPVFAIYTHDLGDDQKVFGGLGPYFAYGLGGKIEGNGFSEKAFDKDFGFKRFDAGLSFTGGYKFNKKWHVRLAFDLGLANIEQESFDKTKNRSFSVNIAYYPEFLKNLTGR